MPGDVPHNPPPNPYGGQSSTPAATTRSTQRSGFLQIELVGSTTCEGQTHPPSPEQRHHVSHHDDPAVRAAKGVRRQTVAGQLKAHRRNERIGGGRGSA